MIFFTICSRNFVGYSGALWSSLRSIYPNLKFYLVLCDDGGDFDSAALQYPVIHIDDLGIKSFGTMRDRYSITELNTSLKPFSFEYIFQRHPGEPVVYLDPDIFVVSRMHELEDLFASGADCVLTPHICEPSEFAEMNDLRFLNYGIYNFGFCALRDSFETRRLVAWWARRLEEYCIIDFAKGLFVDQKWGDYFPAFIEKTKILRHPGYNVAYWNLAQRRLEKRGDAWMTNGVPLRFVHFSGNRIEDDGVFTRHAGQFNTQNTPELMDLLSTYRRAIFKNGHKFYSIIPYAFSWSGETGFNEHTPEELRRRAVERDAIRPHLPLTRYESSEQYGQDRTFNAAKISKRRSVEQSAEVRDEPFATKGYCYICGGQRALVTSMMYGLDNGNGKCSPNWREHLACEVCGFQNRVRATYQILDEYFDFSLASDIYITEAVTSFYDFLKGRFPKLIGSEYLSPDAVPGAIVDGIRHEDIQNLSFQTSSFDLVISLDVLEHIPFPEQAFAELQRCLRPGGTLVFSAPFDHTRDQDKVRAVMKSDGKIEHLLPPEYHGNPLNMTDGVLCYRYLSWDVIRQLKAAGFDDAGVMAYWSEDLKYYGEPQFIIYARKGLDMVAPGAGITGRSS